MYKHRAARIVVAASEEQRTRDGRVGREYSTRSNLTGRRPQWPTFRLVRSFLRIPERTAQRRT